LDKLEPLNGRNDEGQGGHNFPGAVSLREGPKSPN